MSPSDPLDEAEFARLMAALGPFEARPRLALAVSGGADSMALALLAATWARQCGGEAVALTVDHGLRKGSAEEARQVGRWLTARGIAHHILSWDGAKPVSDIQAAARAARYRLLEDWCCKHGALHLLLAHHRDDQAETLLLRLGRGSGVDGLSAMAAVEEGAHIRLLRPLLGVPSARLRATLSAMGQEWIEDPSNGNPAFARVRLRRLLPVLAGEGLTPDRLAATAARLSRARAALERRTAAAAARFVTLHPAGYAVVEAHAFRQMDDEVGLRLLARLLMAVGGGAHPPRHERLEGLFAALRTGLQRARTLSGVVAAPWRNALVFCREGARCEGYRPLTAGAELAWDSRFLLKVAENAPSGLSIGPLGVTGWRRVEEALRPGRLPAIPAPARPALPAIYAEDVISAVPHLGYNRGDSAGDALKWIVAAPPNPLTVPGRRLVW